jgi:hypothetical protein
MNTDETIIRDLNRIANDREVNQQHRNVALRAIKLLQPEEYEKPEVEVPPVDAATLREQEDEYLKIMGVEL